MYWAPSAHSDRIQGKPMIISTGTANLHEVEEMVEAVRVVGGNGLILMQCTAAYPAPVEALNVRAIASMKEVRRARWIV
jgi:N-acetylneuraminate synthase